MRLKLKLTGIIVAALLPLVALVGATQAAVPPSVEGGDIYRVKNINKGGDFTDPIGADKCDVLQYKIRIHNPGPTEVANNVTVRAAFPTAASTQNVSVAVIKADNIYPTSVSDTATVNISTSQKVTYVNGSTQLLDANSNFIATLSDAITGAGVNIGNVGVSTNQKRFVQFKAQIDCPTTPPCVDNPNTPADECNPCKDNPNTPINECKPCQDNPNTPGDDCNPCVDNPKTITDECKPTTPEVPMNPANPSAPTSLPATGPGEMAAVGFGSVFMGALAFAYRRKFDSIFAAIASRF